MQMNQSDARRGRREMSTQSREPSRPSIGESLRERGDRHGQVFRDVSAASDRVATMVKRHGRTRPTSCVLKQRHRWLRIDLRLQQVRAADSARIGVDAFDTALTGLGLQELQESVP